MFYIYTRIWNGENGNKRSGGLYLKETSGQQFLDISQLAKKVRQIEQLKAKKEGKFKENIKERLTDHQLLDMA